MSGCSEGLQTTALVATLMDVSTDMLTPCNSIMRYGEHCEPPNGISDGAGEILSNIY